MDNKRITIRKDRYSSQVPKVRESSMELLRIVAMSMIIIYHFVVHGSEFSLDADHIGLKVSFVLYGVNLFVMISGYYGIRMRWRSFLSLMVTVVFFVFFNVFGKMVGSFYYHGFHSSYLFMLRDMLTAPFKGYWFISCYIVLFLLAPLLNIGLKHASAVQLRTIVIILSCYCLYGGIIRDYAIEIGYTVIQFVLLYIVGYWIRIDHPCSRIPACCLVAIATACSLINGTPIFTWILGDHLGMGYSFSYINVFYFIGSIAIFLLFTRFTFHSRIVNSVAMASLGCYLLQDGWLGREVYLFQQNYYQSHGLIQSLLMYATSFVGLWVASWVLTWFKNLWAPKLIDAVYRALPRRWKQAVW